MANIGKKIGFLFFSPGGMPKPFFWIFYFLCLTLSSVIFFYRFPNNLISPNFYAEDGYIFAQSLIENGLWRSLSATFNGYFIWGIYLIESLGMLLNKLVWGGGILTLPKAFALTSYGFLGFVVTLPILLFKRFFSAASLVVMTLLLSFVPMKSYDYAIIGTIGNLKFVFAYLAFLLIIFRNRLPLNSWKNYLVDLALLVCAYTTVTVYVLLPFIAFPLLRTLWVKKNVKELIGTNAFKSLVLLGLALLPQVLLLIINGAPETPGYMDSPFEYRETTEIIINRTLLYPFVYAFNSSLSDVLVVGLSLLFAIGLWFLAKKQNWNILVFGLYSSFITTLLFVVNRPGISDHFFGYKDSGPDNFFYTQNLIVYFTTFWIIYFGIRKFRIIAGSIGVILLIITLPHTSSFGSTDFMSKGVGTINENAAKLCSTPADNEVIDLPTYPIGNTIYKLPRKSLCK